MNLAIARRVRLSLETFESRLVPTELGGQASICGFVYHDANNNGVKEDGEAGIAGVEVNLEGMTDEGVAVAMTTYTDADGQYCFEGLEGGIYDVCEVQPEGWCDGIDTVGTLDWGGAAGGLAEMNDCFHHICVGDHDHAINYNFGEVLCPEPPCPPKETTGREGLTPGFWKSNAEYHNGSAWIATGYSPDQTVSSVFGSTFGNLGSLTLSEALGVQGGGLNALLRHSVAAVLNAAHPEVDYAMTISDIISGVNDAVAGGKTAIEGLKNQLDTYNNDGADLNQHGVAV